MGKDDLASRIKRGEQSAFEEFRLRYSREFYHYFHRHGLSDVDALDLAGNCITDIPLKVRDHFHDSHTSFDAWVYRLRANILHDWLRRNRLPMTDLNPGVMQTAAPADDPLDPAEIPRLRKNALIAEAVARLEPVDQEILALRYGGTEVPTFAAVARDLETRHQRPFSETSIRQRHARALSKVKAVLRVEPALAGIFR